jgi:hypothetical protein
MKNKRTRRGLALGALVMGLLVVPVASKCADGPDSIIVHLVVRDAAGHARTIIFGFHEAATEGFDRELGEMALPPFPPIEAFDARLIVPDPRLLYAGDGSAKDLRPWSAQPDTFIVRLQSSTDGYPIVVRWDSSTMAAFAAAVIDDRQDSPHVRQDPRSTSSCTVKDPETAVLRFIVLSSRRSKEIHVQERHP